MDSLVLDITTLFPNPSQPELGLFVQRRILALAVRRPIHVAVGVGRFPLVEHHPRYRNRLQIPHVAKFGDTLVDYVRYRSIPRFLKRLDGSAFADSVHKHVIEQHRISPTVLLAELAFPDGLAAMILARRFGLPYVVTLRGHDINDLPQNPRQRRLLIETLQNANAIAVVADALGAEAVRIGAAESRVHTVPNGVDASIFGEYTKAEARALLGIPADQPLFVSVGHLVERKGHHIAVAAVRVLEQRHDIRANLAIVGGPSEEGDASSIVQSEIDEGGVSERVQMLGSLPATEVARWIAAADALVLASSKEGRPNVVLEALCSGTPVVATRVWGTPELLNSDQYGILVERDPADIALGMKRALVQSWHPNFIAEWGQSFSWDRTATRLDELLGSAEREGPRLDVRR